MKLPPTKQLIIKSSITFSTNAAFPTRITVYNIFQIQNVHNQAKYLGLPTLIEREKKKKKAFNYVKDRLWNNRLQGWRTKNLSQADKEILLNTVAQAMPNYVMNVFYYLWSYG